MPEVVHFDPTSDYLDPPLQGFTRTIDGYNSIATDSRRRLHSVELDADLLLAPDGLEHKLAEINTGCDHQASDT